MKKKQEPIEYSDKKEVWECQQKETAQQFAAFKMFYELPPDKRKTVNVYRKFHSERFGEDVEDKKAPEKFNKWRKLNEWDYRAKELDNYRAQEEIKKNMGEHLSALERWRNLHEKRAVTCYNVSMDLLNLTYAAISEWTPEQITPKSIQSLAKSIALISETGSASEDQALGLEALVSNLRTKKEL